MYLRVVGQREEKHNITPLLGLMSAVMLVLLHQEAKLAPVDNFDPLEDSGPSHVVSTSC